MRLPLSSQTVSGVITPMMSWISGSCKATPWILMHGDRRTGAAMDTVIGATDSDAVNIFAARIGDKFGIANKIARVRSLQYGRPDSLLGNQELMLDLLVHPENWWPRRSFG